MNCKLIHHTPDGDKLVAYIARVSNPKNQDNEQTAPKLIKYLLTHKHWSPFEMVSACVEINTTRDIGRQILRHRSFSFQEFSQRYAEVPDLIKDREFRIKGSTNRQGSLDEAPDWANQTGQSIAREAIYTYKSLIENGIAPECARAVLPEGLTPTRMYMHGTLRSWIHYLQQRTDEHTQKEHRLIALEIVELLRPAFPSVFEVLEL